MSDMSLSAAGAVASSLSAAGVREALAITALKSAEKEQAAILQLFASPTPESGRGQVVDLQA